MWVGSGPAPDPACEFIYQIYDDPYDVSEEQKKHEKEHEKLCLEWELKKRRRKNAESVKRHKEKIKAELKVPIEMPSYELSEYELIRQKNIVEIKSSRNPLASLTIDLHGQKHTNKYKCPLVSQSVSPSVSPLTI